MKLYELTNDINEIAENLEAALSWQPDTNADGKPIDDDGNVIENVEAYRAEMLAAWQTTLEAVGGEFDEKAGNIGAYIKNLKSDCDELEKEEKALKSRLTVKKNALRRITDYLLGEMRRIGKSKIDTPKALISIRNNAESVQIDDEAAFILWAQKHNENLLKYSQPEIRKTEVKNLLKAGEKVPKAQLIRTQSLIVK